MTTWLAKHAPWLFLLTAIWCILQGSITLLHLSLGLLMAILALLISQHLVLDNTVADTYPLPLGRIIRYGFLLLVEIYRSGFSTIQAVVTGRIRPMIVTIDTGLEAHYLRLVLANSITLTPGTITLDLRDQELTVLWLRGTTLSREEAGQEIKGALEVALKKWEVGK